MADEQVTQDGGEQSPNPSKEQKADAPGQKPQPQNEPGTSADLTKLKAQVDEMEKTLGRYKEQVKGSSEEALRLKEENDKLQKRIKEMEEGGTTIQDPDFQQIMEEKGLQAAIDLTIERKVASLNARVDAFEKKESEKILTNFKALHPELEDQEMLSRFDVEFEKLHSVYENVNEAMEKALILAGGSLAEKPPAPEEVEDPQKKAEDEKIRRNATGGEDDSRPSVPSSETSKVQKQIDDLVYRANVLQSSGRIREAAELFAKAEDLRTESGTES